MLGHFSFGDYFKREAILWNWEFFTRLLALPVDKLKVSVFEQDDEAYAIWREEVGLPAEKIVRLTAKDNFWGPAGDTGACGPSSELYFDLGVELGCGRSDCDPGCDCDRWIEVGNFVFPQFDRQQDGTDLPLANRGIDTGIGLERLTTVLAGKKTIFQTDLFVPIIERVASLGNVPYEGDRRSAYHIIADHVRALTFALTEGVLPSNEGRGYLIRRLLRRAVVQGHGLGIREPFLAGLSDIVVEEMGPIHPELVEAAPAVRVALRAEEERFDATLEQGLARFEELVGKERGEGRLSGRSLFVLYDTFGFPADLTAGLARERGLEVDLPGFEQQMEEQRERSRKSATFYRSKGENLEWKVMSEGEHSRFVGYETLTAVTPLRRVAQVPETPGAWWVVVETTPCYAESGGQVGDVGTIHGPDLEGEIRDTQAIEKEIRHLVHVWRGTWAPGDVTIAVDATARNATRRNHTATHLLHAALRSRLGKHVTQAGSLVAPNRLRFDFTHTGALSEEDLETIERTVNEQIMSDHAVQIQFSSYQDAIREGVMALFGEKYEDEVRRIRVPGVSEELCGGTHVSRTGEIGTFVILSEAGIAAGVRRIEALTGAGAVEARLAQRRVLDRIRKQVPGAPEEIPDRLQQLLHENQKLKKELLELRTHGARDELEGVWGEAKALPGGRLLVAEMSVESTDGVREMGDRLRERLGRGVGLLALRAGPKTTLLAVVTDDLVAGGTLRADAIVRDAARLAGGSGGGKPHLAMAGVHDPSKVAEILTAMRGRLEAALAG
jgi:alanyl-tRNA synthetase